MGIQKDAMVPLTQITWYQNLFVNWKARTHIYHFMHQSGFFGHLQRGDKFSFPRLILEEIRTWKRFPGHQQPKWLDDVRGWIPDAMDEGMYADEDVLSCPSLKEAAKGTGVLRNLIAKLGFVDGIRWWWCNVGEIHTNVVLKTRDSINHYPIYIGCNKFSDK